MTQFKDWRKSSRSANDGSCVETAFDSTGAVVGMRDTKQAGAAAAQPQLVFSKDAHSAFLALITS